MRVLSRAAFLSAGLACLTAPSAIGYPIPPVPLWSLVEQSDLIVFAEIREVVERQPKKGEKLVGMMNGTARLHILEIWKGAPAGEVKVAYPANLMCPAPPRYVEGEDVVAFLKRGESGWETVGLSYGTLYPEGGEETEDLRVMVRRAIALQVKGRVSQTARLDWLIEAASRPGTRWHGLYELEPYSDQVHSFYDPTRLRKEGRLTAAQRERIARSFITRPPLDRTLPMALMILAGHPNPKVNETAAAAVEGLLGQKRLPYWIDEALELVFKRFGDKNAVKRLQPVRKGCCELDEDGVRTLWRSAQKELGIPKVIPLPVAQRTVHGVGPNTPD